MTVQLTVSETLDGAALSDTLAGGGVGVDHGPVVNGAYSNIIDKNLNTGRQDLFVSHDATIDPITSLKVYLGQYGAISGYTYGGARSAAVDYAALKTLGQASGSSKNNADGLSGGIWLEMDADVSDSNQFDHATRPTLVKIFGDNGSDGIDLPSAFLIKADAMVYNNSGQTLATSPEDGKIGVAGDTVLGDAAHIRTRFYLPQSHIEGGIYQWEYVFSFSFTA